MLIVAAATANRRDAHAGTSRPRCRVDRPPAHPAPRHDDRRSVDHGMAGLTAQVPDLKMRIVAVHALESGARLIPSSSEGETPDGLGWSAFTPPDRPQSRTASSPDSRSSREDDLDAVRRPLPGAAPGAGGGTGERGDTGAVAAPAGHRGSRLGRPEADPCARTSCSRTGGPGCGTRSLASRPSWTTVALYAELGVTDSPDTILAVRGDRLALTRTEFVGRDQGPGSFSAEMLDVIEVDEDGALAHAVGFDPSDVDAAYAELDARYLAGEGAPHAAVWLCVHRLLRRTRRTSDCRPMTTRLRGSRPPRSSPTLEWNWRLPQCERSVELVPDLRFASWPCTADR